MILLDYQDRRPIYEQIEEKFRMLILRGILAPGDRMPSVRRMAMELSINPNTIQRAYMELEQKGLIYPVKGKGNFVADVTEIQKKAREDFCRDFQKHVKYGMEMGLEEETMIGLIREIYKEENR